MHLHNVFWAYISDATQIHLTPGRFRLGAAFHPGATCSAWRRPVRSDHRRSRGEQRSRRWNPILRRRRSVRFVPGARRHEVAIPHRLFVSWFRPASLTACPPREPPPLFEQEHRNAKESIQGRGEGELELDELGLGAGHRRQQGNRGDFSCSCSGSWTTDSAMDVVPRWFNGCDHRWSYAFLLSGYYSVDRVHWVRKLPVGNPPNRGYFSEISPSIGRTSRVISTGQIFLSQFLRRRKTQALSILFN